MSEKDERYYNAYLGHKKISRRGLLRALFHSLPEVEQPAVIARVVPRPPRALAEPDFLAACTGCGDCASQCPEQIIEIINNKAQLSLDYGYCSQCGQCQTACTTGALAGDSQDIQLRPIFASNCQNATYGQCDLCVIACPTNALTITPNNKPTLAANACDGCGRCQQACAFSAISLALENPQSTKKRLK